MSASGIATTAQDWLPTREAAQLLGVQPRALQRQAQMYPLQFPRKPERMGSNKSLNTLYDKAALLAFKERREGGQSAAHYEAVLRGEIIDTPQALAVQAPGAGTWNGLALELLAANLAQLRNTVAPQPKLFMTVKEAWEYSGLPALYLSNQAKAGKLGINVGTRKRKKFRFSAEELQRFAAKQRR